MRRLALAIALLACDSGTQDAPTRDDVKPPSPALARRERTNPPPPVQRPKTIDLLSMNPPVGWTSQYDRDSDTWLFTTPPNADGRTANARIEHADPSAVASPDAYLHKRLSSWGEGTKAEIEKRESVKDGFAMTVVVKPAADPNRARRETYVLRELGSVWYQCVSESVPDVVIRDQLVALCKSIRL